MLDSNPIKFVNDFNWTVPGSRPGGYDSVPIVEIGGIWGTVCFDGFDENAAKFFCSMLGWNAVNSFEPISHMDVEAQYGSYPVLLTNVNCHENAQSVLDCTSGPMGFASCSSGNDVELACMLVPLG